MILLRALSTHSQDISSLTPTRIGSAPGGLVSTVIDEPSRLNWIYADLNTYEIKYGTRIEPRPHLAGP